MQFKDQLDFIKQHMKRNKLRVATTILAAMMGCAFLIILASVGFGMQKTVTDQVLDNQIVTEIEVAGREDGESITDKEVEAMNQLAHVKAVTDRTSPVAETVARLGDRSGFAATSTVNMEQEQKAGLKLVEGKMPASADEVIVGYHFAQNLLTEEEQKKMDEGEEVSGGFAGSLIGQTIKLEITPYEGEKESATWEFTVSGIKEEPGKDWITDNTLLIDDSWAPVFQEELALEEGGRQVLVYADDLQNVSDITQVLKDGGYYVYSVTEELGSMNMFFTALKAGLIVVGTVAVLIASIGIFNTMTMAVTERTREIGVMKAIGAKPKLIQKLFLMESAAIGIIGTVLAILVSYGVSMLANWIVPKIIMSSLGEDGEGMGDASILISVIPWQLVLISAVISIGVAMVSGWRPARKATQIDVIQALRQEL
ncbi:ABC transporter permease [Planococcus sp. NCCP-2050]|uniref:ABC transporter permease n=1 Tax=Planococcus sp. NCCP-2050 TaxID=2944679 RepID=UPI00203A8E23|nr:FtsX-like permease family protein [Planococcus sp. NCCP-2050]GKW46291.1 ABC transporter permease YtrF [Planococcus sp. NCCP-2050]